MGKLIFSSFVPPEVVVIPLLTAKTSVCWNPILYIALNPQVWRKAFESTGISKAILTMSSFAFSGTLPSFLPSVPFLAFQGPIKKTVSVGIYGQNFVKYQL
jgi:hypothetical protein